MVVLWIIVLIVGVVIFKVLNSDNKKKEVEAISLRDRFRTFFNSINNHAFGNEARIFEKDEQSLTMVLEGSNQWVEFFYSRNGWLEINWKMKIGLNNEISYVETIGISEIDYSQWTKATEVLKYVEDFFDQNSGKMKYFYRNINESGFKYKITKNTVDKLKSIIAADYLLTQKHYTKDEVSLDENYLTFKSKFIVDSISNTIIKKIDAIVNDNELTRGASNIFILDAINNSIAFAKQLIDNEAEVNLSDDEKETILSSIHKKVYENYFVD